MCGLQGELLMSGLQGEFSMCGLQGASAYTESLGLYRLQNYIVLLQEP